MIERNVVVTVKLIHCLCTIENVVEKTMELRVLTLYGVDDIKDKDELLVVLQDWFDDGIETPREVHTSYVEEQKRVMSEADFICNSEILE